MSKNPQSAGPVGMGPYTDTAPDQLYSDDDGNVTADVSQTRPPVPVTNTKGYISYRGSEQHGVRFEPDSEGPTKLTKYAAEQQAFETYTSPEVSPRDIVPVRPLVVELANSPDLLRRNRCRIRNVLIPANTGPILLIPQDWNRQRLILSVTAGTNSTFYLKTREDGNPTLDAWPVPVAANATVTVLESLATGPLWGSAGTADVTVILYTEYPSYDGERIIDGGYATAGGNG